MADYQYAYDTQANWLSTNRTPLLNEVCVETDQGGRKIGNGTDAYAALPYEENRVDVPSYAPVLLKHPWHPDTATYNMPAVLGHGWRAAIKKLLAGVDDAHILCITDSTFVGYDGTTSPSWNNGFHYDTAPGRSLGRALARMLGDVPFMGGIQMASSIVTYHQDNITVTGSWTFSYNLLYSTGAGTASWASFDNCTDIEFYYDDRSTTGFTYQVDGGTAVAVTTGGTTAILKKTITGLSDGKHTLTVTTTTGQTVYLYAFRGHRSGEKALHVHSLSVFGSFANGGPAGQNWSNTSSASPVALGWTQPGIWTASGLSADLLIMSIGSNDLGAGTATATIVAGMNTMLAYAAWAGVPTLILSYPNVYGVASSADDALAAAYLQFADDNDVAFFSWDEWNGRITGYTADGLIGADGKHPVVAEQIGVGRHLAGLLAACVAPVGAYSGGALIESGGVYPLRPNQAPAGVPWQGNSTPAAWINGDTLDALP